MVEEEVVVVSAKSTSKPVKKFSEEEVLFNCCHQDHFKRDARQNFISQILFILILDIYNNFQCPRAAVPATIPYILRDPPGGYSGFQVTGMVKGFFGFEIFDSGIFLSRKIWQVFIWEA